MRSGALVLIVLSSSFPCASCGERPAKGQAVVVARDAIQPQVAIDSGGGIYVVFIHKGNICVAVSRDNGTTFSTPIVAMDVKGRARGGRQRGPRIGVDAKKNIVVTAPLVLDEAEYAKKYPTAELFLSSSSDGGKTWTKPLQVNEVPKKAPEALHWLAVAPGGEAHVTWLDLRGRVEAGEDIYYANVAGGKVSPNVKLAVQVCECCAPGLAVSEAGLPVMAWRAGGNGKTSRDLWVMAGQGRGQFGDPRKLNGQPTNILGCPMSAPAVAVSSDGKKIAAAWMDERTQRDGRRVYWSVVEPSGVTEDAPVEPSSKAGQDHPAITMDASGAVSIAWEQGEGENRRIWALPAAKASKPAQVSDDIHGRALFPSIAAGGGVIGLVYEAGEDDKELVAFRRLD